MLLCPLCRITIPDDILKIANHLLFLNDTYATKGMGFPTRQATHWTADVKQPVLDKIAAQIESLAKMDDRPKGPLSFPDRKGGRGSEEEELEKKARGKKLARTREGRERRKKLWTTVRMQAHRRQHQHLQAY